MIEFDTVISPCVSICRVDKKGICIGCYRSKDEIRKWYESTNEEKKAILENVKDRRSHRIFK